MQLRGGGSDGAHFDMRSNSIDATPKQARQFRE
jgi:hypothetical protein